MRNNRDRFRRPTFFKELTPLANAIRNLPPARVDRDKPAGLIDDTDETRYAAALDKRARKAQARLRQAGVK